MNINVSNQNAKTVVVYQFANMEDRYPTARTVEELGEDVSMDAKNPNAKTVGAWEYVSMDT